MSDSKILSDDMLSSVSGGTNAEMIDIKNRLKTSNLKEMIDGLKKFGIQAELSSLEGNKYTDLRSGKELSHEEVLNIISSK